MTISNRLPRILVATSNNFNLQGGGGITLTNLFRGWPADRVANIHEDPTPPDRSVCSNFFRLTRREVHWSRPLALLESGLVGRSTAEATPALASTASRGWTRWLVGDGMPRQVVLSQPAVEWIEAFRPDVVYSFLGSMAQIRLARKIADRWKLPMIVHIMDDWPSVIYTEGLVAPLLRPIVMREFGDVLRQATVRLVISDAMADEYGRRYGYRFSAFHNALDIAEWHLSARREWRIGNPVTVRYVGSILADAQRGAMRDMCDAVAQLRATGLNIVMSVHAPAGQLDALRGWHDDEVLQLHAAPPAHEVPRLLSSADVLVLPFNFDESSLTYIRLSMPTKVPAYMASGTPVLVYGPPTVAAVNYAREHDWGETVTARGPFAVADALGRLVNDERRRSELGQRAMAIARDRHDVQVVRERFWNALSGAVAA